MGNKSVKKVSLEDLAAGVLPKHVLDAFAEMEVTVGDMQVWEQTRPKFRVRLNEKHLNIDVRLRVPITKVTVIVTSVVGALGGMVTFAIQNPEVIYKIFKTH